MNNISGIGEKSSVRVNNAPGGKSNFSLGWGNEAQETEVRKPIRQYNNQSSVFGSETTQQHQQTGVKQTSNTYEPVDKVSAYRVNQVPGGQSSISFGEDKTDYSKKQDWANLPNKTSVKVQNPPGGKSSIQF